MAVLLAKEVPAAEPYWRVAVAKIEAPLEAQIPGRTCPIDYFLDAAAFRKAPTLRADLLYVVGGLYGNTVALDALMKLFESEPCKSKLLVLNGDFHWFDRDPMEFLRVEQLTARYVRLRGNVETELARDNSLPGCGCAYPPQVDDDTVGRSNQILAKLKLTAQQLGADKTLLGLPMVAVATVGMCRIAITHGDERSLAGWRFAPECIDDAWEDGLAQTFRQMDAQVIASSHTCSPVAATHWDGGKLCAVINNGSAGMGNFSGSRYGLFTRISLPGISLPPQLTKLYSALIGGSEVAACELEFDAGQWIDKFTAQWPEGSEAQLSYWERINQGTSVLPRDAARGEFRLAPQLTPLAARSHGKRLHQETRLGQ